MLCRHFLIMSCDMSTMRICGIVLFSYSSNRVQTIVTFNESKNQYVIHIMFQSFSSSSSSIVCHNDYHTHNKTTHKELAIINHNFRWQQLQLLFVCIFCCVLHFRAARNETHAARFFYHTVLMRRTIFIFSRSACHTSSIVCQRS